MIEATFWSFSALQLENAKLAEKISVLKLALDFYANDNNWRPQERTMLAPLGSKADFDKGTIARKALEAIND